MNDKAQKIESVIRAHNSKDKNARENVQQTVEIAQNQKELESYKQDSVEIFEKELINDNEKWQSSGKQKIQEREATNMEHNIEDNIKNEREKSVNAYDTDNEKKMENVKLEMTKGKIKRSVIKNSREETIEENIEGNKEGTTKTTLGVNKLTKINRIEDITKYSTQKIIEGKIDHDKEEIVRNENDGLEGTIKAIDEDSIEYIVQKVVRKQEQVDIMEQNVADDTFLTMTTEDLMNRTLRSDEFLEKFKFNDTLQQLFIDKKRHQSYDELSTISSKKTENQTLHSKEFLGKFKFNDTLQHLFFIHETENEFQLTENHVHMSIVENSTDTNGISETLYEIEDVGVETIEIHDLNLKTPITEISSDVINIKETHEDITIVEKNINLKLLKRNIESVEDIFEKYKDLFNEPVDISLLEEQKERSEDIFIESTDICSTVLEKKECKGKEKIEKEINIFIGAVVINRDVFYTEKFEYEDEEKVKDISIDPNDIGTDIYETGSAEGLKKVKDILIEATGTCTDVSESEDVESVKTTEKDFDKSTEHNDICLKTGPEKIEVEALETRKEKRDIETNIFEEGIFDSKEFLEDQHISELTNGIEFIQAFESQDCGDHVSHNSMRSIDDLRKDRDKILTNLSQNVESSIAEMNAFRNGIKEMVKHLNALEKDLIKKDRCCRDYRKQIDDLEFETISLQNEISILGNDREALVNDSPFPHWLTIFDRTSQTPHVGTEEDQTILDEMETCPTIAHLPRKDLTLAMIDRLIGLRQRKVQSAMHHTAATQRHLTALLNARAATAAAYQGLLTAAARTSQRLSKARRTFNVEVKKSRRELRDAMQRPLARESGGKVELVRREMRQQTRVDER